MKRFLLCLLLLSFAGSSTIFAVPSMRGRRGILRVLSARTTPMADLCVNIHGEYAQSDYPTGISGVEDLHIYPKLHTGITYGVAPFFEFSVLGDFYAKYNQTDVQGEEDEYSVGLQDAELGVKFGHTMAEDPERGLAWVQGLHAFAGFARGHPPNDDSVMVVDKGFRAYIPQSFPDLGIDLLTDLEVSPLTFMLNVGYLNPGDPKREHAYQEFPPDTVDRRAQATLGAGVEIEAGPYVRLITEVMWKNLIESGSTTGYTPPDTIWVTPGIRFITPVGVSFNFGCDFALTDKFDWVPDWREVGGDTVNFVDSRANWNAIVGVTITSSLRKPVKPIPTATIAGKITDAETGDPLGAEISFPGTSLEAINSDPETGLYKLTLKPGLIRIHVSKAGYLWKEKPITLKAGRAEVLDFELAEKRVPEGIVTGKVTDASTGKALGAKISFPDTKLPFAASDMATGIYKTTIAPGTYSAKAEAEGYDPETLPVVVKEKETVFLNFKLHAKKPEKPKLVVGERIILRGINFATGSATIRPMSYPILDDAARTLKANPKVRVEIGGHTDSVGSASYNQGLSEARAASVRSYLISAGIEAERLVARGYGESMPVASNATSDGRQENRRIEFLILSR